MTSRVTGKKSGRKTVRFIDLFAGVGGMRSAFEAVGGMCVFSSEWDKHAAETYFSNFSDIPHGDITKISEQAIPDFDILLAGFPCQPFSSIGKREGFTHKTQGTLFFDVLRIVSHKKPRALLLENVAGLISHDNGNTLKTILESLEEIGYRVQFRVMDAAYYGVPQRRRRIYLVGFRTDQISAWGSFEWPRPTKLPAVLGATIKKNVVGYEISTHLQEVYIGKMDDGRPQILNPRTSSRVTANTLVASYHKIQRLTGTFVADGPTGLRLLSIEECKAIMGFPKSFTFPVSRTQAYRQLGNSVAIPLVKKLAKSMFVALEEEKK